MGEEGVHSSLVLRGQVIEALLDGGRELLVLGVVGRTQALRLDELPDPLDQVQIGRVRRQVQQFDPQLLGQIVYQRALLVACIVQHQGDRQPRQRCRRHGTQQQTDRLGIDVAVVADLDQLVADTVQRRQYIVAFPPGGGAEEQACHTPDHAQERGVHEMRGVHEE